jgi:anti-sigma regulatory factor (Ser/Thr protein kinase)
VSPVVLTFVPGPEHVRTARLVVVAVARRAGLEDSRLDDVRLAVGELCARAVSRCAADRARQATLPGEQWVIQVEVDDTGPRLEVRIEDPAGDVALPEEAVTRAMAEALSDGVAFVPPTDGHRASAVAWWNRPVDHS